MLYFTSQVCSSRPVAGQVRGCVQALVITCIISIKAYVIGLFIDVVFVSRGVLFVNFVRVRVGRLLHILLHEIDVICFC
jgi:hypothetical protein